MRFDVEGMDCGSCVGKIETALARLPGVADIRLNFATQQLDVALAPGAAIGADEIVQTIERLGFGAAVRPDEAAASEAEDGAQPQPQPAPPRWWQTRRGRQVLAPSGLMGAAYAVSLLVPVAAFWIFMLAVLIGVLPFVRQAWALARAGSPFSIETLMSAAALGALLIGEAAEAAAVVWLFSVGELLESVAADRARAGIRSLASLVPSTAIRLDAQGGQRTVPAAALRVDDRVLVRPGDRVPADGVILQGASSLDESPITGESIPRAKRAGDGVFAGSVNVEGVLQVRVSRAAADNTIARIIHLVEEAQASKAPTARFIERFSRGYTPAVMALAALVMLVPPLALGGDWPTWLYRGLALLLIACPCALVLSTPAAIASGLAAGTRHGLLVKGGHALETIGRVGVVVFDKTGTLTAGVPHVTDVLPVGDLPEHEVLALCAGLESGSSHPLAHALVAHARAAGVGVPAAAHASASAGRAVHAEIAGRRLALGSPGWAAEAAVLTAGTQARIDALQREGKTVSVLLDEEHREVLGLAAWRDEPRPDAQAGVAALQALGVEALMLTGDNPRTAQAIADPLGLAYQAELLPQDKLRLIDALRGRGRVAMVGDGINDAPALAAADVGIAMGGGTDVALETADAALLQDRVADVARLVALSRATLANIHQNVVFALGLKGVFLLTTLLGVTGLWMAVLADAGATALVTLNALRLLRFKGAGVSIPPAGRPVAGRPPSAGRPAPCPAPQKLHPGG
ncbi:heavy metal translocating P-type ATPase [Castellaniella ginsengisoli]|uniref:P-type Zn(2+) transporter n=1 Tax=Castellaniella ginsengisoli TaxID=546114 RepID=A0AB39CI34_9BURK